MNLSTNNFEFPRMLRVRQRFQTRALPDVGEAVRRELGKIALERDLRPGERVALTAGSRGIAHIALVLRETVRFLRGLGAKPFVIPAMGSHGGGTAEGQVKVLAGYGITEESVGCPIRASMEVIEVGRHAYGGPVYLDKLASQAEHVGVVARVKPHTSFAGPIESGLFKMMMIGLGKHAGALAYHRDLVRLPWEPYARSVGRTLLSTGRILFGLAVVENADDETGHVEAATAAGIEEMDERLLKLAYSWMPRLPFLDADLLIIDEIGKDVSGAGFDPNVLGRKEDSLRRSANGGIRRIFVRDLTEKTRGNATGIGMADFTTRRLVEKMDYRATVTNCMTANRPQGAAIPVHYESDREAIEAALKSVGLEDPSSAKVQRILNTLQLGEMWISANYPLAAAGSSTSDEPVPAPAELEVLGPAEFRFDADGNLADPTGP